MLPIANLPSDIHFSNDEMAMLLSLKVDDLFNQTTAFDDIHNSDIELFRKQADLREWLNERLPAVMSGEVGEIHLTKEQAMYVRPKMVEMNSLIRPMEGRCKQDVDEAWDILIRLGKLLNEKLDLNINIVSKEEHTKPHSS